MKKWRIVYRCDNGFEGEEFVYAVNRMMAWDMFEEFGLENVVAAECLLVEDENGEVYEENYNKYFSSLIC